MLLTPLAGLLASFLILPNVAATPAKDLPECCPRVVSLATGIHLNIAGQYGELNGTESLLRLYASDSQNHTLLLESAGIIQGAVAGGMNIRKFNQQVAPAGNAALPGLAKYAAAQETEAALAASLDGAKAHDLPILEMIKKDVEAGIMLNEQNLRNATKGCKLGFTFPGVGIGSQQ